MSEERISPEELNRKLADLSISEKDLSRFFMIDEERSSPFRPALRLNPQTVQLPEDPELASARSEAAMTFANRISRTRRLIKFECMIAGDYTGPVIVSEGDSWFQYPILLDDTIDHLYDHGLAIRSLDAAGDTLENMLAEHEYMDAILETGASIFLLSAGGNDALGGGNLRNHLRDYDPALSPAAYLLPSFGALMDHTIAMYERVLREVETLKGLVTIFHGYDYAIPNSGQWLGKPMASRGIVAPQLQRAISRQMIDAFNDRLSLLAIRFGDRVVRVDARGAVGDAVQEWHDELHPTNEGYGRVAARFSDAIGKASQTAVRRAPRPVQGAKPGKRSLPAGKVSAPARRGWSLHIGLNKVSPAHYGDECELNACHFDAEDMARIAHSRKFENVRMLLDGHATRKAVKDAISEAADTLKAGDLFLVTYSGHGSQVPDFNADESDSADETLCLFDGMLIDDELYALWTTFKDDVRVVMLSDSCHSGSVLRDLRRAGPYPAPALEEGVKSRLLPLQIAARTFRQNRDFYTELGRKPLRAGERVLVRELDMPLRGSLLLISGCQDNQTSLDGIANGRFTQELLRVWDEGRFSGDWRGLHRRIVAGMPPYQTPNLMLLGRSPATLAAMHPFSI
ncbi:MAG: caspase family protein [Syntrophobacteraceae bacterium]|nr:caspase family protein [Desulfobacteraceae bacterium]